jgi:predicted heme/steroid binding protein
MEQLKQYNGTGPEGRVLVAVNGKVFDVTKGIILNHYTQILLILTDFTQFIT